MARLGRAHSDTHLDVSSSGIILCCLIFQLPSEVDVLTHERDAQTDQQEGSAKAGNQYHVAVISYLSLFAQCFNLAVLISISSSSSFFDLQLTPIAPSPLAA